VSFDITWFYNVTLPIHLTIGLGLILLSDSSVSLTHGKIRFHNFIVYSFQAHLTTPQTPSLSAEATLVPTIRLSSFVNVEQITSFTC